MDYIANIKQINAQKSDIQKGEKLPAVFPLVVYNGSDKWTASERLADLVEWDAFLVQLPERKG
jgi:hypothetical protein